MDFSSSQICGNLNFEGDRFQVYLVTHVHQLNTSYISISLHDNVLLEQFITIAIKQSYYSNWNKKYLNK